MGKLILCHGSLSSKPYYFESTGTNIYSMEELAYYIFHNIFNIYEDTFTVDLAMWIEEELNLQETGRKLYDLIENKNSLKDIVVTLLCASDYYGEEEISELIRIIDETEHLAPVTKRKVKADILLEHKKYNLARILYTDILNSSDCSLLTKEETGNIIHNQAVIELHTGSMKEASVIFKKAYLYNKEEETLKEYLYSLRLSNSLEEYRKEILDLGIDQEFLYEMDAQWQQNLESIKESATYQKIKNMERLREEENFTDFYEEADDIIGKWKKEIRGN